MNEEGNSPEVVVETEAQPNQEAGPVNAIAVAKDMLPEQLPILPLSHRPMFPKMMGPIVIDNQEMIGLIRQRFEKSGPAYIGLVKIRDSKNDVPPATVTPDDLHQVGVAARVLQMSPFQPDMPLQILVQALSRFDIVSLLETRPLLLVRVNYWSDTAYEANEELKAYAVAVIDTIKELVKLDPLFKEGLSVLIERININDPGALADIAATMTTASGAELQEILEIKSIRQRIEKVLVLLKRETEISRIKVEISKRIEEGLSKQQREFFLKQQLKEIKKELGLSKEDSESESDKFRNRLKKLKLSEEAEERINEELEKLSLLEPASAEFNVTRAYLDWLTILPWGVYTKDSYNIKSASRILDEDHYGLRDVKDRILELISVGIIKGDLAGSIILLVGPPGVGKTSIGQSIARSLGRKFFRFSLGGMRDEAEIKGHRRTYIGALPGKFIQSMKTCKTANPVIMLDEVDKIGMSFQGDPASALLEVLDPEQNRDFLDHYLDVRFDLSKVLFICTANQLETIPRPLLDRMEMITLSGYILEEKLQIAKHFLLPKQLKLHGLKAAQVEIPEVVLRDIIDGYAREAGVRSLENSIKKILRKSAKRIVEDKIKKVKISAMDLPNLLGRKIFTEEDIFKHPRAGVVMGLAYTTLGGATLFIEATQIPAKAPGFKHTGQLGQVMVESSEIAYTYIRSFLSQDPQVKDFFNKNFIHLHVPAGATPKDGPSAGITMACALYSLAKNLPIKAHLAMTGELTLTGMVMPIGGVKEKLIAAARSKVQEVILPENNREDYDRLDDHVKKGIKPHFISEWPQLIPLCFPKQATKKKRK